MSNFKSRALESNNIGTIFLIDPKLCDKLHTCTCSLMYITLKHDHVFRLISPLERQILLLV